MSKILGDKKGAKIEIGDQESTRKSLEELMEELKEDFVVAFAKFEQAGKFGRENHQLYELRVFFMKKEDHDAMEEKHRKEGWEI